MSDIQKANESKIQGIDDISSTEQAIAKCENVMTLWNRSHSNFLWKSVTIGDEYSDIRRLRQVGAEMQSKKTALLEAKYNYLKMMKEMEIKQVKADGMEEGPEKDLILLEIEETMAKAELVENPLQGAIADVKELAEIHDSLLVSVEATYGELNNEVFEKDEAKYWIKRSLSQSLRDVRQHGAITKGEQELLEQIGLDPYIILKMLLEFLQNYPDTNDVSSVYLETFLEDSAERFFQASTEKMKRTGVIKKLEP